MTATPYPGEAEFDRLRHEREVRERRARMAARDYGTDVERFNAEHGVARGCKLGRTVGSDYTECDTHHAHVKHGVPPLLRDI